LVKAFSYLLTPVDEKPPLKKVKDTARYVMWNKEALYTEICSGVGAL